MKNLISIANLSRVDIMEIMNLASNMKEYVNHQPLKGKTVVLFFPPASLRTRVTFEKGIVSMGGQAILFDSTTLDKPEAIEDVMGYLNNWVDLVVVRHDKLELVETMAKQGNIPIINAMTATNHPCEILSDLFALSKIRPDYLEARYLIVAKAGNVARSWHHLAQVLGLDMIQSCPEKYRLKGMNYREDITQAIKDIDVVCTDSLAQADLGAF